MTDKLKEGLQKWKENGMVSKSRQEKFEEKPTRRLAIDLFCIECVGGEEEQGYRNIIRNCPSEGRCPLYMYRPYK